MMAAQTPLLVMDGLSLGLGSGNRAMIVPSLNLTVNAGECLGLVGESGSGKSLSLRAILGLLPNSIHRSAGRILLRGPTGLAEHDPASLRGNGISMVFQEPMSSLNPSMRIGDLVAAGLRAKGMARGKARTKAISLLREVGFPAPEKRLDDWPHQLSGGLRQRVMIAMALSVEPALLLCDEPTTALDVTTQEQILLLLERLKKDRGLGILFVTHDLSVISRIADRTAVMYAGRLVEEGPTAELLAAPRHPYTLALLSCLPQAGTGQRRLQAIDGTPPAAGEHGGGCIFAPRCTFAAHQCLTAEPVLADIAPAHRTACYRHVLLREGLSR
ncbi:MAG TPA: ABC transporter ATP-binding protein [Mesorhizobium sp.]|jgi:oligopeptide/dipeptide ABC transporter ATP-binding protein|uniref:ABC transporter ATP-binding protein n=1 Tax=Mesorhizobium sp. TaxID=1871066 RepID=UPI002DDCEFDD|nr:ABC transporter ATP-binding protein [Mesorhizobium sp.]HEV2501662.1 ABC transporter ATP-binding protein [Mesorhizobium sp.]